VYPSASTDLRIKTVAVLYGVAALLLLTHVAAAAMSGEVVPVDGEPFRAVLKSASPDWKLQFESQDTIRELPAADLVRWGDFVEKSTGPQVLLADGSQIVGDVHEIDREKLLLDSDLLGRAALPLGTVTAVLLHPPSDRHRRDQLVRRLLSTGGENDRILLDNGDELAGTVAALHDDVLTLESADGKVEVELARITAIVFNPSLRRPGAAGRLRAMVGLSDGSRVLAVSLDSGAAKARLTLADGTSLQADGDAIVALQPLGGRAVYLSDLKPASYKHIPFLQLSWPYEIDRNVAADLLRGGGKLRLKGLGMHSASRLTYNLDREYRRLDAELAIDDATAGYGSVVFRVFVDDGSGHWEPKFTSGIVRGGAAPVHMSVDLTGAKRISLLVEFADRGDQRDDADWLDARLIE
jgi:hypothetical protein